MGRFEDYWGQGKILSTTDSAKVGYVGLVLVFDQVDPREETRPEESSKST
jgi:hypothetical protein